MFGLSGTELLIVAIIAIIFIKPEDLPRIIRNIGKAYGHFRRLYYSFLDEINSYDDDRRH